MASHSNDAVINPQLYHHLVTGNIQGYNESVSRDNVGYLRYPSHNSNVLHIAASFGHVDLVHKILEQCPDLFLSKNKHNDLALHSATKACKMNVVDVFIQWSHHGHPLVRQAFGWKNADGNTALHIALENCEQEMAWRLLHVHPPAIYVMNLADICPLYLAIKSEMAGLVEHMLIVLQQFKKDANGCLREGKSVLQTVISAKKIEMLQHMLRYDQELIYLTDKEGKTALSYAAYMGDLEKARLLLNSNEYSAFIRDEDGTYPIHQAVRGGHTYIVNLLADSKFLLNAKGQNIIHEATLTGNPNLVVRLLDSVPDIDSLINQKDDDGNTPLHLATLAKNVGVIKLLLQDVRINVGVLNKEGLPAYDLSKKQIFDNQDISVVKMLNFLLERAKNGLKFASVDGHLLFLLINGKHNELLVELKDLGCLDSGSNILHIAASMDPTKLKQVIDSLFQQEFNLFMEQANYLGDLPIHSATKAGKLESLEALFERSTIREENLCLRSNIEGNTPLHIAVLNNQEEIARYLYTKCPRAACSLNKDKFCPLFLAILYWHERSIVTDMIDELDGNTIQNDLKGANSVLHAAIFTETENLIKRIVEKAPTLIYGSHDSKGRSPLSYAAYIGYAQGVRFLLQRYPELEFYRDKDDDGSFPIHQATRGSHLEIIKLLHPEHCLVNSKGQNILHVAAQTSEFEVFSYLIKRKEFNELLNTRDEDGNTLLHLAAKESKYFTMEFLIREKKINLNALNNKLLTAKDMFQYKYDLSSLFSGVVSQLLSIKTRGISRNKEKVRVNEETDAKNEAGVSSDKKQRSSYEQTLNVFLVVAALIITATFTAAFTPPGGYNDKTGFPLLHGNIYFETFIMANFFAFGCAVEASLFLLFGTIKPHYMKFSLDVGGQYIFWGIIFMLVTFTSVILQGDASILELTTITTIVFFPLVPYFIYDRLDMNLSVYFKTWCRKWFRTNPHLDYTFF